MWVFTCIDIIFPLSVPVFSKWNINLFRGTIHKKECWITELYTFFSKMILYRLPLNYKKQTHNRLTDTFNIRNFGLLIIYLTVLKERAENFDMDNRPNVFLFREKKFKTVLKRN